MNNRLNKKTAASSIDPANERRIQITLQCKDAESLPRVPGAGKIYEGESGRYQLMHNGIKVIENGYIGPWVTELIRLMKGFHEPQEEKAFAEILHYIPEHATMLELGSWWSYYSLWFQQKIPNARNYMIEPDINNLMVGKKNFELNKMEGHHVNAAIGKQSIELIPYRCYESDNVERQIPVYSVDDFLEQQAIQLVDLLLADIQGYELEMLEGATRSMQRGGIRFMVISTHHHTISHDPLIHQKCLEILKNNSAKILVEHTISESFSGDGLIVASLNPMDQSLPTIEVSRNLPRNNLFRETENDLSDALTEREGMATALKAKEAERQQLEVALNAEKVKREQLEKSRAARKEESQQLKAALRSAQAEQQGLAAALNAKEADRQQLEVALNAEKAEREQLEKSLAARIEESQQFRAAMEFAQGEQRKSETALNAKEAERQELESALIAKESERQRLAASVDVKETERQGLDAALNAKEVERQKLAAVLIAKEAERLHLSEVLNIKEIERQGLDAALNAKEVERKRLAVALTAKEAERKGLDAVLNAKETERHQLEMALNAKEKEQQELTLLLDAKKTERQQLETSLIARKFESEQYKEALKSAQAERQQLEAALDAKEVELQELAAALEPKKIERRNLETVLTAKKTENRQLKASLHFTQARWQKLESALEAKEAERQQLQVILHAKEVERQGLDAALNAKEAERQLLATSLFAKEAERQRLAIALAARETEQQGLEAALNAKEADRQRSEAAWNAKQAELDSIRSNRDQIFAELIEVYHSRSFRLTKPLRIIFIAARNWKNKLRGSQDRPELAALNGQDYGKSGSRQMVDALRRIPWIAILLDKFKQRNPRLWYKIARQVKQSTRVQPESLPSLPLVASDQLTLNVDESHFLNLFERELSSRQAKNKEMK